MSIMVSYRSANRDTALEVYEALKRAGLAVWIDQDIQPGQKWRDELLRQLRHCSACVPILTPGYVESEHCRLELFVARSFGRQILPVMAEECWSLLDKFEETRGLSRIQGVKLYNMKSVGLPISRQEALARLIAPLKQKPRPIETGVYISYFSENAAMATAVAREINALGIPTWIATLNSTVGMDWRNEQARAMVSSACHLVLLRPGISQNEFLKTEVMLSEAVGIPIYPALEPQYANEASISEINSELRRSSLVFERLFERHAVSLRPDAPLLSPATQQLLLRTVHDHKPGHLAN